MQIMVQRRVVFLNPVEVEDVRESGIIVAAASTKNNVAEIAEMHEADSEETGLKVGDRVLFNPFSVRELHLTGTESRLAIHVSDILAKVTNEETN